MYQERGRQLLFDEAVLALGAGPRHDHGGVPVIEQEGGPVGQTRLAVGAHAVGVAVAEQGAPFLGGRLRPAGEGEAVRGAAQRCPWALASMRTWTRKFVGSSWAPSRSMSTSR